MSFLPLCTINLSSDTSCQWRIVSISQNQNLFIKSSDGLIRFPFLDSTDSQIKIPLPRNDNHVKFCRVNCRNLYLFYACKKRRRRHQYRDLFLPALRPHARSKSLVCDLGSIFAGRCKREVLLYSTNTALHWYWVLSLFKYIFKISQQFCNI